MKTTVCSRRLSRCLRHQHNPTLTWWRVLGLNRALRLVQAVTTHFNILASIGTFSQSLISLTHRRQRQQAARRALLRGCSIIPTTILPYERSEAKVRSAERFTEWKTDIFGAPSAGGKRRACDSQTKRTELYHFTAPCRYYIYSTLVAHGLACHEINEEHVYRLNIL